MTVWNLLLTQILMKFLPGKDNQLMEGILGVNLLLLETK